MLPEADRCLQFDGVLSGQHIKRRFERIGMAFNGDRTLLHRFQQGRLRLGRSTVDFVGQYDVRKNRPLDENAFPLAGDPAFFDDFRTGDIGRHQIGRELNAFEIQMKDFCDRRNQKGLRQSRDAGDDGISTTEHRHHHLIDNVILTDNYFADFSVDPLQLHMEAFNCFEILLLLYG